MKLKSILIWLFVGIILVFSFQNAAMTDVKFLIWKISISRILIVLGSFGLGILVGLLGLFKSRINSK